MSNWMLIFAVKMRRKIEQRLVNTVVRLIPPRARICTRLRSPGIDSEETLPPDYIVWQAGTTDWVVVPVRQAAWKSIPGLLKRFTNTDSWSTWQHIILYNSSFRQESLTSEKKWKKEHFYVVFVFLFGVPACVEII